jgi:8-oxo-dGTP pyrophosphatase MutT (NUDIX family)
MTKVHAETPQRNKLAYGGVLVRDDGCILLRQPSGEWDGYVWTFAKGNQNPNESPKEAALREVLEETGIEAEITGEIPGWFASGLSTTHFYWMRALRETGNWNRNETQAVEWVPLAEAHEWIGQTRNLGGRARDLAVLEVAKAALARG